MLESENESDIASAFYRGQMVIGGTAEPVKNLPSQAIQTETVFNPTRRISENKTARIEH